MDIVLIIVLLMIVIIMIVGVVIYVGRKTADTSNAVLDDSASLVAVDVGGISIPIERLSALSVIENTSLAEITDISVVSRIIQTIPTAADKAAKTITNSTVKNADIYRVIIPSGETLVQSKDMAGAFRGFFRGAKGAKGHANLVKVDPSKISKASTVANIGANVMNVGSLVVGQYYMSEINARLETMSKNISKISDFQDREFKSRIMSLAALVCEISQFSVEIIENDELRKIKLAVIESLKASATELLGQVNETIINICKNKQNPDYRTYQENVEDFAVLAEHQKILIIVLEEISKLYYLLGKGSISNEMCYSTYQKYLDLSAQANSLLGEWHDKQVKTHKIDLSKNRKSKSGIEGFIASIPSMFDDDYKYKVLKYGLADKITSQVQSNSIVAIEQKAVYDDDVKIVIKDGKYHYQRNLTDSEGAGL